MSINNNRVLSNLAQGVISIIDGKDIDLLIQTMKRYDTDETATEAINQLRLTIEQFNTLISIYESRK